MDDPLIGFTINFAPAPARDDQEAPRGGLGSQVLPVAELADDYDGSPEDGMEYLFMVRREAAAHARVNRVSNPYEVVEALPSASTTPVIPLTRPNEAWRLAFFKQFQGLRTRLAAAPPLSTFPPPSHSALPPSRAESEWKVFINGRRLKAAKVETRTQQRAPPPTQDARTSIPEEEMTLEQVRAAALASLELDAPSPPLPSPSTSTSAAPEPPATFDENHPPHLPTPSLILEIDHPTIVHLLSHFTQWFTERQELYDAEINYVPSTIFAPPALRRKVAPKPSTSVLAPPQPTIRIPPRPPLPTSHEVHWVLSLLSKLDSLLAGDEMSTVRDLAKVLLQLVEESEREKEGRESKGRTKEERARDEEEAEGRARSWMVVAAVAAGWGQSDLWNGY